MKRPAILGTVGAMAAIVVLTGSTLAANGFINGGFVDGPETQMALAGGSTNINGWTVTGPNIDYLVGYWESADGDTKSLDLSGLAPGGIKQTFATTINSTYVVQFWMSGNPENHDLIPMGAASPTNKTMTVSAPGGPTTTFEYDTADKGNTREHMLWEEQGYSFKATSANTTLTFTSTTDGAFGPALDKVIVTEVAATGANCKDDGWQDMRDASGNLFRNQGACVSFYAKSGATPIGR